MSSLSPPKQIRTRASSTSCSLTLKSLGRRRSTSCLNAEVEPQLPPADNTSKVVPPPSPEQSSTMIDWLLSKFVEYLHMPQKHALSWSTPSSPRSSSEEELILPLSASAQTLTFSVPDLPPQDSSWRIPPIRAPLVLVILLLPISTVFVLWCLSTLPISLSWPHDIADLAQIGRELHGYSQSGPGPLAHVVGVMAISAIWKHAWSIPGSVLWNVLAGALFSPLYATILLTTLTTVGSACATLLATPLGPFIAKVSPRALDMTRTVLGGDSDADRDISGHQSKNKSSAWVRLSVLRLIGVVPWSGINLACGICKVPLADCMLGTFIGCLPWTAVTCQIGDILQTVASTPSPSPQTVSSLLATPEIILKLIFLSVLSLAPILGRSRLHSLISSSPRTSDSTDERRSRLTWVKEWRTKIRLSSQSRKQEQEAGQLHLDTLVQEKRRLEDYSS